MSDLNIAVIGLGPCGASQLFAFRELEKSGVKIPNIVCYEKQSSFGGQWNQTWETGITSTGDNVHSAMYNHLWTNSPKECIEIPNYSFDQHFGKPSSSFPPYSFIKDYLNGFYKKADCDHWVKFNTSVKHVKYSKKLQKFKVTIHDQIQDKAETNIFDYVICATGHFHTPNFPDFKGMETFTGRVLHSRDFREAKEYKGKKVVIIGAGYSCEDIASQIMKYGGESIVISYRTKPTGLNWRDLNVKEVPMITEVKGDQIFFKDETNVTADVIMFCTGYVHSFPFMEDELRLKSLNKLWVDGLYKGVVQEKNTKMLYLGMQNQLYTFSMFGPQAWWARDYIMEKIERPSDEEMVKNSQEWAGLHLALKTIEEMVRFQGNYIKDLLVTDYPKFDLDGVHQGFMDQIKHREISGVDYRDHCHKSNITGTMAVQPKTKWYDNKQDGLEEYLGQF